MLVLLRNSPPSSIKADSEVKMSLSPAFKWLSTGESISDKTVIKTEIRGENPGPPSSPEISSSSCCLVPQYLADPQSQMQGCPLVLLLFSLPNREATPISLLHTSEQIGTSETKLQDILQEARALVRVKSFGTVSQATYAWRLFSTTQSNTMFCEKSIPR